MSLGRPTIGAIQTPAGLLNCLDGLFEAVIDLLRDIPAKRIPALKAITLETHAAARAQVGDVNGEAGPRACIVAGRTTAMDGGQGVFVWDPNSTLADDDTNTLQVPGASPGRWRKI